MRWNIEYNLKSFKDPKKKRRTDSVNVIYVLETGVGTIRVFTCPVAAESALEAYRIFMRDRRETFEGLRLKPWIFLIADRSFKPVPDGIDTEKINPGQRDY